MNFSASSFAVGPQMPALWFKDQAAYEAHRATAARQLAARRQYEDSLAPRAAVLIRPGTCAPCLAATTFTSATDDGERLPDGRCRPLWREAMVCACRDGLNNRDRALLHFLRADGVPPGARMLLAGERKAVDARLAALAETLPWRPFSPAPAGAFHLAVANDFLQLAPDPAAWLAKLCEKLLPGGRLVCTVPFQPEQARSVLSINPPPPHQFGWDLLDLLRSAGLRDASACQIWSEELGYLGLANFIFRAVK